MNDNIKEEGENPYEDIMIRKEKINIFTLEKTPVKEKIKLKRYKEIFKLTTQGFICGLCKNVMIGNVAITPCNHKFCSSCIYDYYNSPSDESIIERCPTCPMECDINDCVLSDTYTAYLNSTIVMCKNIECKKQMTRMEYHDHISVCEYNKVQCDNCKTLIYKKNIKIHKDQCFTNMVPCKFCNVFISSHKQEDHVKNDCPYTIVKCENNLCNYQTQRYKMCYHMSLNCYYRKISCPNAGCIDTFEYRDLYNHCKVCPYRNIKCRICKEQFNIHDLNKHKAMCG